ncbi:hypothetical protein [Burkholderia multivorans]|uniref:hypothetical protein n=1 Tax=Burkholderia multivorans TaxID=87883 RepID=UPI003132AB3E
MDVTKLVAKLAQECINNAPIVVLGSGASAAHGIPGMFQLGEHLKNSNLPADANEADRKSWKTFCEGLETLDLESALTQVVLTEAMTRHVVWTTWDFLNPYDLKVFEQLIANRRLLPLTRLFQHLFRSTVTDVQVVTPNYDRIAEYAAEAGNFTPYTGFTFGTLASRSPKPPPSSDVRASTGSHGIGMEGPRFVRLVCRCGWRSYQPAPHAGTSFRPRADHRDAWRREVPAHTR